MALATTSFNGSNAVSSGLRIEYEPPVPAEPGDRA
jgi:hypothetical protein